MNKDNKIVIFGAAGLVGHNLCLRLYDLGYTNIIGIDKNTTNTKILESLNICSKVISSDINNSSSWINAANNASVFILAHAQISSTLKEDFVKNNINSTNEICDFLKTQNNPYVIHISSSVVNSKASDFYTETKINQENIIINELSNYCILRPTLMFGWFDRKHLGWLSRFMTKTPIFPIPGNGNYSRQPLYVKDFCNIIAECIKKRPVNKIYDISGLDKILYIDIIKTIKRIKKTKTIILYLPIFLFRILLDIYSLFSKNPPFTSAQLDALIIPEDFPSNNWEKEFGIQRTNFDDAVQETFLNKKFSNIELEF